MVGTWSPELLACAAARVDNVRMGLQQILKTTHELLDAAGIEHALIGGLGLAALGIHRATFDVDYLVPGRQKSALKIAMEKAGWKLAMETTEVLHYEGKGRVDFLFANRPLTEEMLQRAQSTKLGIKCIAPEGIIGLKIQAYKNDPEREFQDKADIKSLVDKFSTLDWELVRTYADLFGEWGFVESLRKK